MEITVKIKSVYGIEKIYPVCEKAIIFAQMLGCKTLTQSAINHIKKLGYKVLIETNPTEL